MITYREKDRRSNFVTSEGDIISVTEARRIATNRCKKLANIFRKYHFF